MNTPHQPIVIDRPPETVQAPPTVGNANEQKPAKPPMYAVLLHNDDTTKFMDVVDVLNEVFKVPMARAKIIMMTAHREGKAVVAIMTLDQAETRCAQAANMVSGLVSGLGGPCELTFTYEQETKGE